MIKASAFNKLVVLLLVFSFGSALGRVLVPQSGGASAFQGQDIMGGAAIVFKRPQRVRDIVGGASLLVVKRQPRPANRPEVARNTPDRRRPVPRPGEPEVVDAKLSDADQGEAYKAQGNTYYDLGDFAHAIEAYQNAAKHVPKDATIFNNLGAAYFSTGKSAEAIAAFKKALAVKPMMRTLSTT